MDGTMSRREFVKTASCGLTALGLPSLATAVGASEKGGYFQAFGVDKEMVARVLGRALLRGGDFTDVYFEHTRSTSLGLEDGEVNRATCDVALGAGVRVVQGDQTGYAYSEVLTEEALLKAATAASAIAADTGAAGVGAFAAVAPPEYYALTQRWSEVPVDRRIPMLRNVNEAALGSDHRIKKVRVYLSDSESRVLVAGSDGRWAEDWRPMARLSLSCLAEEHGRREENYQSLAGRVGPDFYSPKRVSDLVSDCVRRTVLLFEASPPPPGEYPVVLAPGSSGILLHEAIGHGMEADFNRKGESIYSTLMGESIAEKTVTIVDDASLPNQRGSLNVDDEGTVGQRTVLVENGRLVSYMHDLISAAHYGVAPTGNGRRQSFRHAPIPRMRATYMLPGPHDPEEMVRSVSRGIYTELFSNGQVTIGAGDFSFYVKTGFLIEGGKLTRPVKDANIVGNGPEVLRKVVMVGDDLAIDTASWTCGKNGQGVPVSQGLPTVKVSSINVGGVA
jgi:TldD protein